MATTPEGGLVHVSGGMPHTFATTPDSPACFFVLHTPSGSGEFHSAGGEDQFIVEPGDIASCSFPVAVDLQVGV